MANTIEVSYGVPGVIEVIATAERLNKGGALVLQHMLYHIEDRLEQEMPGGSIKYFCCRATFNRYLRLVRKHAPNGKAENLKPFRGILKAVAPPAFKAMIEYCNLIEPSCLIARS